MPRHSFKWREESKERTYPELVQDRRCRLVVLGLEIGGRWRDEAATFPAAFRPNRHPAARNHRAPLHHHSLDPPLRGHAHTCGHACLRNVAPGPRTVKLPYHSPSISEILAEAAKPSLFSRRPNPFRGPASIWLSPMHLRGPPLYKQPPLCQMPGVGRIKESVLSNSLPSKRSGGKKKSWGGWDWWWGWLLGWWWGWWCWKEWWWWWWWSWWSWWWWWWWRWWWW